MKDWNKLLRNLIKGLHQLPENMEVGEGNELEQGMEDPEDKEGAGIEIVEVKAMGKKPKMEVMAEDEEESSKEPALALAEEGEEEDESWKEHPLLKRLRKA